MFQNIINTKKIIWKLFIPVSFLITIFLFSSFFLYSHFHKDTLNKTDQEQIKTQVGLANPSAVYCKELGYSFEIEETGEGEKGICTMPNNTRCGSWDFLKGKCGQDYSYCAQQGYGIKVMNDGKNALSREYAVCTSATTGEVLGSVTKLMNLIKKSEIKTEEKGLKNNISQESNVPPNAPLPSSFSWTDYNGENWMTSIRDQGICGSCWSFSAVGTTEGVYNINAGNPDLDINLAEQYMVSNCFEGNSCDGGWQNLALAYIRDYGVPDESCMPYVDGDDPGGCSQGTYPDCPANCTYKTDANCSDTICSDRCSDWNSRLAKIDVTGAVSNDPTTIKQYLITYGPLAVSYYVGDDLCGYSWDGVYRCVPGVTSANHAVTLVGYNDTYGYWIIKNSWGAENAYGGYDLIGYDGYYDGYYVWGSSRVEEDAYYADVSENQYTIQNSNATDEASFGSFGNIILNGTCSVQASCVAPDHSFIIQDSIGNTVSYIDSNGNLCLETGNCTDQSLNCDSPNGKAFIIQNSLGDNVSYIDETGDLCTIGAVTQSGNP